MGASSSTSAPLDNAPLGHTEPRVFTPPLRPLTRETSAGFRVIDFAEQILRVELYPWQKWLLIHALELNPDGMYRFRTIVVLVARQNGKSTLGQVLALWAMYVAGVRQVLGTAQNLDVSSDLWRDTVEIAEAIPELAAEIKDITRQVSRETLTLTGGRRYQVAAASRRGGRGKSGDLVLMDELREHQTWHAWSAITKTTMARRQALVWCMSNAGDASSVVLRYLRRQAHGLIGDPDDLIAGADALALHGDEREEEGVDTELDDAMAAQASSLGLFEWSAPPGVDVWDMDGWAAANPSLGYGELTARNIAAAAATDPEWEFRTEVLCQWFDGALVGPFETGKWDAGRTTEAPPQGTPYMLGVDMAADRAHTHIVAAYHMPDGAVQVSLEASRAGSEWVVPYLQARTSAAAPLTVGLQDRGAPISFLAQDLEDLEHITVYRWGGTDLGNATAIMKDLVDATGADADGTRRGLYHLPAPALDIAAGTAALKKLSDGGLVWDRVRSPRDAAPIVAATIAVWLLTRVDASREVSAYDSGAALTVLT